jgi:N-acetyl-anhydromuramyl-L-alanine amidase AmpD
MTQYPSTAGCRSGYACASWGRYGEPSRTEVVCVPDTWVERDPCIHPTNFDDSEACYFDLVSFSDPQLETLTRQLLDGTATAAEAEAFLDLNHELSQTFVTTEFGVTLHDNRTSGHSSTSPMRGAIVHYTAAAREDGTIRYFVSADPHASTHFVIGSYRNGLIVQLFSHRDRTWHAGSTYNIDRFGIDFANAGFLRPDGQGGWETYSGASYELALPGHGAQPVEVLGGIPTAPVNKYDNDDHWQPYTYYQLLSYVAVMRALHLTYGLQPADVERHGDVSGSRVDPGPALPLTWLNELVFSDEHATSAAWLQDFRRAPDWIGQHPEAR